MQEILLGLNTHIGDFFPKIQKKDRQSVDLVVEDLDGENTATKNSEKSQNGRLNIRRAKNMSNL